jgi:Mrp family chromosome partitioning ATPase
MTVEAIADEKRLSLSMPMGGGHRETVELAKTDLHPALVFAHARARQGRASFQRVTDGLLHEDWWWQRQVFVSSPVAGDGKTSTAFNLAWALSTREKSVLLIELNFSRPRFCSVLGDLRIHDGIDGVLRGTVKPEDSIFTVGNDGLHVSAVRDALNKQEIRKHLSMLTDFLEEVEGKYDWLVLDCPPVLSPLWDEWFQENANPVLMVVRAKQTPLLQVERATWRLGANLKGTVMNAVDDLVLGTAAPHTSHKSTA